MQVTQHSSALRKLNNNLVCRRQSGCDRLRLRTSAVLFKRHAPHLAKIAQWWPHPMPLHL